MKTVPSIVLAVAIGLVGLSSTASAGERRAPRDTPRAYGGFTEEPHGVKAAKAGILYPLKTTGRCGPGFYPDKGQPGDETCFQIGGILRCPNVCRPKER